jgi:hypothetical protein
MSTQVTNTFMRQKETENRHQLRVTWASPLSPDTSLLPSKPRTDQRREPERDRRSNADDPRDAVCRLAGVSADFASQSPSRVSNVEQLLELMRQYRGSHET